ncbi:(2Fe-2S)-binding protein [Mycobacterium sp. PS03-16]|uniref:(2Fe-2S)-binding protein n=1 Tax=Mycobacterium sp. PS03-16 TaxID=2559611 RepID=UPI0010737F10|nr:(2Fe-2S)-binding protein [Mycobacterium sp. PS03-16]TFV54424.1 (2Fe-2S)-binding protein [Mycobacterium sp. PS03-16]
MFVCLCLGITNETVAAAVCAGARTTKQVAGACGAGSECGRCRRTVRAIIAAHAADVAIASDVATERLG